MNTQPPLLKVVLVQRLTCGIPGWQAALVEAAEQGAYCPLQLGPHSNCRLLAAERASKWAYRLGVHFEP
jgi:hypothetical protein